MAYEHYMKIIHVINLLSLIGGIITAIVGATMLPQTVTNIGDKYIGEAAEYNEDLRKAQMGSYGFKLVTIGLSITAGNCLVLLVRCYCIHLEENVQQSRIQPAPIKIPLERRVTISPTVIEIPDNSVNGVDKSKNIKKWTGDAFTQECII
jgi:hypothetical protein